MEKNQTNSKEYYTIDIMHILRAIWQRAWIVVLIGVLMAGAGFGWSAFMIQPSYSSSILLYVNNSSINLGNTSFSISASDISASQSLVKTYTELLKNRTTLERVAEKAGVDYSYLTLSKMISAGSSNETEIMKVTVTGPDPYEAAKIANTIAEVLPVRISEIIDGASMEVVDSAVPNLNKVSPSVTKYTALFMMLGVVGTMLVIAVSDMLDDTIHDEDYIIQNYEYPILAKIPNLLGESSKGYGYYYYRKNPSDNKK